MSATIININDLSVLASRQRKTFSEQPLDELERSIRARGLLQPLVVRKNQHGVFVLVAGERRLRAIKRIIDTETPIRFAGSELQLGHVPVVDLGNIEKLEAMEAEFAENSIREDLTWQERVEALDALHKLKVVQHETDSAHELIDGLFSESAKEYTIVETAKELVDTGKAERMGVKTVDGMRKKISKATIIAQHLDDEVIAKAQSESQAFKLVMEKLESMMKAATVNSVSDDVFGSQHVLFHGKMQEVIPHLPDDTFDVVITDPPYGIGVEEFGSAADYKHGYSEQGHIDLHRQLFSLITPKLQAHGCMYIFCDIEMFPILRELAKEFGFNSRRVPLIWNKGTGGHLDSGKVLGFRRNYELIFHCSRENTQYRTLIDDVISIGVSAATRFHAAQKPDPLYIKLAHHCAMMGSQILDPFAGSGPIFAAAKAIGAVATGIEADAEMAKLAAARRDVELRSRE